ncbi:hypothetical protein CkaCkLH20_04271 [Colletotrichum karsti]|uniref:Heterokaryon incompatibility domain-containing protein n=1 Tax=Colletotrichum karsti TaxID=1095194 RepID=A0A9P6LLW6_9PEZI|nr:uncharacterized protein CkaCkLH20_04271 [Colletotrichum karsti]KAF9878233.1 hypothetical protein CkaCkLH20_04271 [Colletotrichum karsti]
MNYATSGQHLRWPPYPRYTYNQWKTELENGFDPNTTWAGSNDRSPLFIAVLTGDINLTALLLNYGAQTEDYNDNGMTVLHEAILKGHEEIAKLLLRCGANPNLPIIRPISRFPPPFYPGSTALHLAVLEGLLDVARCLMHHGADSQAMTLVGWTPVDVAVLGRQTSMLEILLDGCKFELFEYGGQRDESSEEGEVEITRHLLENGIRGTGARHVWFYRCQLCRLLSDPSIAEQGSSQLARFLIREMSDCLMKRARKPCQMTWDRKLCEACETFETLDSDNVFNAFEHSPNEAALALSANKGCNFCQFLLDALQNHPDPSPIQENWLWQQFGYDSKVSLRIERKPWRQGYKMRIMCGESASTVKLDYVSRQINEAVANTAPSDVGGTGSDRSFAIANAWLRGCQDDHPSCYHPTELGQLPTRVIDVGSESSPPYLYLTARERIPYAALSYCWGGQGNTRLLSTNADEYRTRLPSESLPRTISEAIEITRRMGVRYLWVDALCIMQDSTSDLEQELSRMGDIYFNAWLTIAAKDSAESSQGCFRERDWHSSALVPLNLRLPERVAQSRLQDQGDTWLTRAPLVNTRTSGVNRLMAMPRCRASPQETPILETRGWTLQEELLSRRMLIFGKDEVSWVCLETACSERRQTDVEVRSDSTWQNNCRRIVSQGVEDNRTTFKVSRPQVWAYWLDTVESFSRRRLSDRRDKVVALEGVQRAIGVCLNDEWLADAGEIGY